MNRLPEPIEWLTDNGSSYVAGDTKHFACDIGLVPRTTPVSSPQSNGMAEAFVRTLKRDYVRVNPRPDARTVIEQLPAWLTHYNEVHPHKALGYRSPREYITQTARPRHAFRGQDTRVDVHLVMARARRPGRQPGSGAVCWVTCL